MATKRVKDFKEYGINYPNMKDMAEEDQVYPYPVSICWQFAMGKYYFVINNLCF